MPLDRRRRSASGHVRVDVAANRARLLRPLHELRTDASTLAHSLGDSRSLAAAVGDPVEQRRSDAAAPPPPRRTRGTPRPRRSRSSAASAIRDRVEHAGEHDRGDEALPSSGSAGRPSRARRRRAGRSRRRSRPRRAPRTPLLPLRGRVRGCAGRRRGDGHVMRSPPVQPELGLDPRNVAAGAKHREHQDESREDECGATGEAQWKPLTSASLSPTRSTGSQRASTGSPIRARRRSAVTC